MIRATATAALFVMTMASCSPSAEALTEQQATTTVAKSDACALQRVPGARVALLRGACPRTATAVADGLRAGRGLLDGVDEVALGRVSFDADGVFDRCDLLGRLAKDPRWTATIDSAAAQPVLAATLSAMRPAEPIEQVLGVPVARINAEMVILEPAGTDCPTAPALVPAEAQLWLVLRR